MRQHRNQSILTRRIFTAVLAGHLAIAISGQAKAAPITAPIAQTVTVASAAGVAADDVQTRTGSASFQLAQAPSFMIADDDEDFEEGDESEDDVDEDEDSDEDEEEETDEDQGDDE